MFTGIIESLGEVVEIKQTGTNKTFTINSSVSTDLKVDQSIAHNGVCLTVVASNNQGHDVTAVDETLRVSNLGAIEVGSKVNLERCTPNHGRFDGHIVQGHVDTTATVRSIENMDGSWKYSFQFKKEAGILVEKGSVCVNGVSLTCFEVTDDSFAVAIIPYTFENTTFQQLQPGDSVNIEFDIIGKYVARLLER